MKAEKLQLSFPNGDVVHFQNQPKPLAQKVVGPKAATLRSCPDRNEKGAPRNKSRFSTKGILSHAQIYDFSNVCASAILIKRHRETDQLIIEI